MPGLRLHHRIVIPFALVALVALSATAYVVLSVTTRSLAARVEAQVLNTARLVSASEFALNPGIIGSVKAMTGADVVTFSADGTVLASTTSPSRGASVIRVYLERQPGNDAASTRDAVQHQQCDGPCDVAYSPVVGRSDVIVAVVADTTGLVAATRAVTRTVLMATVISLLVMVGVGQLVARRVTAPLDALVRFTRGVGDDGSHGRAQPGADEVGRLAAAFNDMLDRLDHSRAALVRSEKLALAGLFASRVAHDIRNPLSSIKMQTQLLRARLSPAGDVDGQNGAILEAILRDIAQVESVIRDLMELARPGALSRRPTSLNVVVRDVLAQLVPHLTYRKIAVEALLADGLPDLPLDAERLKQALLNVVNNAADAMPTGGTLTVCTRPEDEGSTIVLDVCDDGIGVDPAVIDHVFDPFVSTKRDGVGLGLVNAKAVVESHGGTIELAPRAPRGTRATVRFPLSHGRYG